MEIAHQVEGWRYGDLRRHAQFSLNSKCLDQMMEIPPLSLFSLPLSSTRTRKEQRTHTTHT